MEAFLKGLIGEEDFIFELKAFFFNLYGKTNFFLRLFWLQAFFFLITHLISFSRSSPFSLFEPLLSFLFCFVLFSMAKGNGSKITERENWKFQ